MEMGLVHYFASHPSAALVILGALYWIRRELGERNGHGVSGAVRKISKTLEDCSEVMHKISSQLTYAEDERERLMDSSSRIERKIDNQEFCPMAKRTHSDR